MRFAKMNNIGDISGKSVSQFTASTLIGVALGLGLSKVIDITVISQLYPVFILLSAVNLGASYMSVKVIDEIYLNNQRAFILFNEFFKSRRVMSVEETNSQEIFTLPTIMNLNNCKFIKYG